MTQEEVRALLVETGAIMDGHFFADLWSAQPALRREIQCAAASAVYAAAL